MIKPKDFFSLFKKTFLHWSKHRPARHGAAVSYYAIFSLAPLFFIVIAIIGLFLGNTLAESSVLDRIGIALGSSTEDFVRTLIASTHISNGGAFTGIVGILTLLLGATGIFAELTSALDDFWDVEKSKDTPKKIFRRFAHFIKKKFHLFLLLPILSFAVIISLSIGAVLQALGPYGNFLFPKGLNVFEILSYIVPFLLGTILFALMYHTLPSIKLPWKSVFLGAFLTSILFLIGEFLITYYIAHIANVSVFGAAGSFIAILIWIYFSSQIFFLGASFTYVYSQREGLLVR